MTQPLRAHPITFAAALCAPLLAAATYAVNVERGVGEEMMSLLPFAIAALVGYVWLSLSLRQADLALYAIAVCLMGVGLVLIRRAAPPELFEKQRVWAVVAVVVCCLTTAAVRRPSRLSNYTYVCGIGAALLLVLTMVAGTERNGAKLWLPIGGLSIQPSEFSKLLMCLFLAAFLAARREALADWSERALGIPYPSFRHLGPLLAMWAGSVALVVFQKDLGCALVLFCVFLAMLHVATSRVVFVVLGLVMFGVAAYAIMPAFPHVATRLTAWLNPWPHIDGAAGHQIIQGLFGLASGGVVGTGIGRGLPETVPVVESDFIFAALGEELGLAGAVAICLAYVLFVARAARHAERSRDDFSALLCAGLAAGVGLQAAIIIGGVTRAIPMTGITLPFVSYGGSSLTAGAIALGLLLRLSARANANDGAGVGEVEGGPNPVSLVRAHVLAFALLSVWIGYWQVVRADELGAHPRNPRLLAIERQIRRGRILDRSGATLAENGTEPGSRVYPLGPIAAHITGYRDDVYGLAGIEASCSGWLLGLEAAQGNIFDIVRQRDRRAVGYDVRLTLDERLQRLAWQRLGNRRGAVVALDPGTGEILALVSRPSFDPANVAMVLGEGAGESSGLLARATQGLYPPGSVFKVFTAAAALDSGAVTPDHEETCAGEEIIDNDRIRCHSRSGHGTIRMEQAVAGSCNIYFAHVGRLLGPRLFEDYARRFEIDDPPDIGISVSPSGVPTGRDLTPAMLLESSFGQGALQVTPLRMALIGAVVANRGALVEPRLIDAALEGEQVVFQYPRGRVREVISTRAAEQVAGFMRTTAASGTGRPGAVPGITTAAKTGSAENPHGKTHAWFVAFAPFESPRIAVAVVVENAGAGGAVAGPIARDVMADWLKRK